MKVLNFIKTLEELGKPVFGIEDFSRILRKDERYVKVYISRAAKLGFIKRIEKNKYMLNDANILSVASNLVFPSYISFISALAYYKMTTQFSNIIFVVIPHQKKDVTIDNYTIKFVKFAKHRLFGYVRKTVGRSPIFIAEPEKAIIDSLLLPKYCPLSEVLSALKTKELSIDKLISYALKIKSKTLLKRVGYLLDLVGIDIIPRVKNMIDSRYHKLNPILDEEGEKNKKWKLIINEVL